MKSKDWKEELDKILKKYNYEGFVSIDETMEIVSLITHELEEARKEERVVMALEIRKIIDGKSIYQENGDECGTQLELIEWLVDTELDNLLKEKK